MKFLAAILCLFLSIFLMGKDCEEKKEVEVQKTEDSGEKQLEEKPSTEVKTPEKEVKLPLEGLKAPEKKETPKEPAE